MKWLTHAILAVVLAGAFLFAQQFEQRLRGDFEWLICFGIVFAGSFVAFLITRARKIILVIAALAPFSAFGMFVLVNICLSVAASAAGLGLGSVVVAIFSSLNSWRKK